VHELNASKGHGGRPEGLEPNRRSHLTLDRSVVLFEHTVTSRAINTTGKMQPAMDDPIITNMKTYWESNGRITRHVNIT
jgi:hypothetical protein